MRYNAWKFELIRNINNDTDQLVTPVLRQNEINCVLNGDFDQYFSDDVSPQDAWNSEKEEIRYAGRL